MNLTVSMGAKWEPTFYLRQQKYKSEHNLVQLYIFQIIHYCSRGKTHGASVGLNVGLNVGLKVGLSVGLNVGLIVGVS
jgi:hypothetical protein